MWTEETFAIQYAESGVQQDDTCECTSVIILPSVRCADTNIKQGQGTRIFQTRSLKSLHSSVAVSFPRRDKNLSLAYVMKNTDICTGMSMHTVL
jgi:hypothetical protein